MPSFVPPGKQQFSDMNGNPLAGGSVYTYAPGTTTPKATFQDLAGQIENTNPIVLDANGEAVINGSGSYQQAVYDALGNLIWNQATTVCQTADLADASTAQAPLSIGFLNISGAATVPTMPASDNSNNAASTAFVQQSYAPSAPLYGLYLSNNGSTGFGVASGGAISDDASALMVLANAFTKTLANFVAGSGNGSLDTGSIANSTWYHIYLIYNPATKTADILASASATAPSLPTGFTKKVRLGAIYNNAGGSIVPFVQNGNEFLYVTPTIDVTGAATVTGGTMATLTVPTGLKVNALLRATLSSTYQASGISVFLQSPDEGTNLTPSAQNGADLALGPCNNTSYVLVQAGQFNLRTNVSGQIRWYANAASGAASVTLMTRGFIYLRGIQ